ncbi:hypothetical protein LshimejAT787_2800020 [Lyophyllum shimeji]|uniref:Uncharacterized protein n=1 Tax=Lyophyllum shimeji TaxID=47721 RepID=A0A9P3PZ49_LYOSH|nr:hypothetical protein LshimejAT787_2800020 [Lyophyllum shimeji]
MSLIPLATREVKGLCPALKCRPIPNAPLRVATARRRLQPSLPWQANCPNAAAPGPPKQWFIPGIRNKR